MKFFNPNDKQESTFDKCMAEYRNLVFGNISERVNQLNERAPNFKPIDFEREQSVHVQGQILPFASILKNYKSYKSQWEQR
ncbi:TPA: hypothetical protein JBA51_15170, partial [Legionella pneumophila subsp. pneumophila]|nr:hypothetical protein [Legionella pneumophila subsp. pneumophila]HCE5376334.1 hypothetical protein [Legionella pneumophila]HAT8949878.1 hypothetical protein [Legionella pneumophila subsp. pneumophila]HAT9704126.1 hypothetical protein [Legionella pneumophila subsp. pneumophila]HCE5465769.1 hypothetical protein [Legionella pneumophila]